MSPEMAEHGCRHADAPLIRSGYDACFAYVDGDPAQPRFSAGVAVHGGLRMWLTYRGAIMWKMNAGMGDTIFAPLYLALQRRGVNFAFFHRVNNLGLSADGTAVDRIDMTVQATLRDTARGYDPIVPVGGVPCWVRRLAADQFQVFAINCTHLGCPVRWFAESNLFMCPCHGGVYYADGEHASGPPPRRLYEYEHKVENDTLLVRGGRLPTLAQPV